MGSSSLERVDLVCVSARERSVQWMYVCERERDRQRVPLRQMLRLELKIAIYLFFHTLNYHHTLLYM